MSSGEIEDVLSSIRRLVSEDLRPAARKAEPPRPQREGGDKLLLTPALRVVQDEAPVAPPAPALPEAEAPEAAPAGAEAQFHSVRSAPAADAVAALGAAMGQTGVQDESGDEEMLSDRDRWDGDEAAFIAVDDEADDPAAFDPAPAATRTVEADEAWQATLPEDATATTPVAEAEDWVPEIDLGEDEIDPHWQTDEAEVVDPAARQGSWADAAAAEVLRELSEEAEADAVFGRIDEQVDALYDEELLRELVRDIIREELQGALGERITRNVRKLVRAEIARALAVRDFE